MIVREESPISVSNIQSRKADNVPHHGNNSQPCSTQYDLHHRQFFDSSAKSNAPDDIAIPVMDAVSIVPEMIMSAFSRSRAYLQVRILWRRGSASRIRGGSQLRCLADVDVNNRETLPVSRSTIYFDGYESTERLLSTICPGQICRCACRSWSTAPWRGAACIRALGESGCRRR